LHLIVAAALIAACQPRIPPEALRLDEESLKQRQVQTRLFQTDDEIKVLTACSTLLQDIGFNIDETESELGVIVGSKDRSAVQAGEVIGAVFLSALFGSPVPWDKNQRMKVSIITRPVGEEKKRIAVRVTFQRIVWNTKGRVSKKEGLTDPAIYQEFFDKLSKSLFLEAQEVL
jgi:hypothetical protein